MAPDHGQNISVAICEVGPRDGLQNEARLLAPAVRAELVARLAATGVACVEAVSFVNEAKVPAMAGAAEVVGLLGERAGGPRRAGLVLNERGYERLAATGLEEVHVAFGVTETFNRRNQGAAPEDSLATAQRIVERARRDGRRATVTLAVAFGCPFEGRVDPARVVDFAARVSEAAPDELVLADTIGVATPRQVRRLVEAVADVAPAVGLHLHNTRNAGYANAYAGIEAGVRSFDASVGGTGGCPFAPGATGNVATEDLVKMLHADGIPTGIDLDALIDVARWLETQLGFTLPGMVHRAGAAAAR